MMTEMLIGMDPLLAALVLLVGYGFAPGAALRLIVLAFPRDDFRREELLAELYAVPRRERPVWVFEQLEVALSEGLLGRARWAATGRVIHRWRLKSGLERHRESPSTFEVPSDDEKISIAPRMSVKLIFEMRDGWGERMWVDVEKVGRRRLTGRLGNQPLGIPRLSHGDKVKFKLDDVIDIVPEPHWQEEPAAGELPG
ncbi:MAG: DUF2314 domain-containing protein [Thermoleophilaceae bacterium]